MQNELGDLVLVERDRSAADWPDYEAEILVPVPNVPSNWTPLVHLGDHDPEDIREFANALLGVAERLERDQAREDG